MRYLGAVLIALAFLPAASAREVTVRVDAGSSDRVQTPVFASLPSMEGESAETPVCVRANGTEIPGQIEVVDGGALRVWWIVDELSKGAEREYVLAIGEDCAEERFHWNEDDLFFGEHPVLRYEHPTFSLASIEKTKKPFHHVYTPDGRRLLTKGLGGLYPHHRGIYFGYNRCKVGERTFDTWHARKGEHQQHREQLAVFSGPVFGGHVVRIDWNDRLGRPFATETRSLRAFRQQGERILLDFSTSLVATEEPVRLEGDRQHAGVQFRAAQAVAENQKATRYLRPEAWKELPEDDQINDEDYQDLPWNAVRFPLDDRPYLVAYLSDPSNPEGAKFSERLYGRFGEYFPFEITKDTPLIARYRWWIATDDGLSREDVARRYRDLAETPTVTVE